MTAAATLQLVEAPSEPPRLPWLKFFPSDWLGDELLRMCSLAAHGLLAALMCVMHKAVPYGHVLVNGRVPTDTELARLVGARGVGELRRLRSELLKHGVLSVTEEGILYSRRMVRTASRSSVGRANGLRGGNPRLRPLRGPDARPLRGGDNTQKPEAGGQNPQPPAGVLCDGEMADLAEEFLRRYSLIYAECRSGATYPVDSGRYLPTAVQLVTDYRSFDRLLAMVEIFLRRKDVGDMGKPGSPRQFQHYAPDCDRLLKENGR
jgi:hypothetical protein